MIRGECTTRGVVGRRTRFGLRDSNGHEHRAHAGLALDSHLRHSAATARPYRRTKGVALCAGIAAAEAVLTRASECIPGARAVSTMHAVQTSQRLAAGLRHRDAVGMDATELRELQSPLKRKYRDDPAAAATPLRAEGDFALAASPRQSVVGPDRCEPACIRRPAATGRTPVPATCSSRPCLPAPV